MTLKWEIPAPQYNWAVTEVSFRITECKSTSIHLYQLFACTVGPNNKGTTHFQTGYSSYLGLFTSLFISFSCQCVTSSWKVTQQKTDTLNALQG